MRILLTALAVGALSACGAIASTTNTSPATSGSATTSGSAATGSTAPPGSSPATSTTPRDGSKAIPRLAGDTLSVAELYLKQVGLQAGQTLDKPNTKYQSGLVITTSPYAGDIVPYGSVVELLVSTGSPGCQGSQCPFDGRYTEMPDVIGQTIDQVTTTLALDGITLGSAVVEGSSAPEGTVICTDPDASALFPLTMPVKVGVSSGDPGSPPATLCSGVGASSGPPPTSPTGPPTSPSGPPTSPSGPPTSPTGPPTSPSSTPPQSPSSQAQPSATP